MRALVTGAGGFLGRVLSRALLSRGHEVRALVRPGRDVRELEALGVELARGDALDPEALAPAVRGCPLVFHLAGVRRAARREDFVRGNVLSTRLLLDACERAGGVQRFVLAGSLAACGPSREGRREDDPLDPHEWYGESKADAERLVFTYRERLPVAVARPPRIMGPGDRENLLFFRIAARRVVLRFLGPERPLSWIDVDDCARGFALLGEHPAAAGNAFFLASDERTSVVDLQRAISRAVGVRPREIPVPPVVLRAAAAGADVVTRLSGRRLPLNRKLARQILAPGWTCDTTKARDLLGFEATAILGASLDRAVRAYRDLGWLRAPRGESAAS
ncbi:MAG TPA: NAD-dependent epimerase/dehydratase family protein [Anaeromyxobacteraceae bacterium]|nr:NAD-dependent epimerase/dehydratase family protein [Anaeromyxobacteraceae bacterium]